MNLLTSTGGQPASDNLGLLLTQHVKTILESGLLLDEDYEVLLKASNFKIYPVKSTKLPLGLIASALTTLGSVCVAKRYDLPLVVLPPSVVTFGLFCWELKSMAKRRRQKEIPNYLVQCLIKVQKLNATIIRYTKLRIELSSSKEREALLYNENFKVFIKFYLEKYLEYFKICKQELEFLANLSNDLSNDFQAIKHMDIDSVLISDCSNFNDYLCITSRVQDVYIFLSSKFLNYLALTFCKNLGDVNAPEVEFLLDLKLPYINGVLDELYGKVQQVFNNLRYGNTKKIEIDIKNKGSLTRHVSGKLQQTLIGAVNNLSIIMEKSQTVLHKVESAENENDIKKLESALSDLRDHAFHTYESLNVLCKLYGIFSQANKSQSEAGTVTSPQKNNDFEEDVQTLSYDDANDPLEESYELFIPKNDPSYTKEERDYVVDQSGVYLNLMLKELRQSLKQHERFIAARDRRGIKDEDEALNSDNESNSRQEKIRATPKFDLTALEMEDVVKEPEEVSKLAPVPPPRPSKMPPPPPPPPPSFNLSNLEADNMTGSKRSLFENIRTLSSQLQGREDIFGGDGSSDSD